jgi:hypothetical protein
LSIRRVLCLPLVAALAAIAIACGGDAKPANESASSAPGSGASSNTAQFVDLRASTSKLEELKSFRFDFAMKLDLGALPSSGSSNSGDALGEAMMAALFGSLGDIRAEGAYVAPNQVEGKVRFGGQEMGYVQIGEKAWVKQGANWQATSASSDLAAGFSASPTELFEEFLPEQVLRGAKTSRESVNGVSTTKYSFDKKSLENVAKELGEDTADFDDVTEMNFDIWLMDGNVPVKVLMAIAGKGEGGQSMSMRLEMNVRDINSDSIRIRPPI